MSIKNAIKRTGVVFILGPVFVFSFPLAILIWGSTIVWGPFYYIFTGKDPMALIFDDDEGPFNFIFRFADWYMKNFGPDDE